METYYTFDTGGNVLYEQENREYMEYLYVLGKHFARVDGNLDNLAEKTKYFYHTDHLGSTVLVTDEAGQQVWSAEYTPFGKQVSKEGELDGAAKFTGKDLDEDTGLHYFNARWYDQEIGRFVSEDPARDGLNWYQYTYNNPLKYVDPDGQKPYLCTEKRTYGGMEVQYYSYYGGSRGIEGSKIIASLLQGHSILQGLGEKHLLKMKPIEKQDIVSAIRGNANEIEQYGSLLDLISDEAAKNGGKLLKSAKSVGKIAGIVGNALILWDAFDWFASTKSDQIDYLITFYIGDSSTEKGMLLKYNYLQDRLGELVESGQIKLTTNILGDVDFKTIKNMSFELSMELRREMMLFDALRIVNGEETEEMYWHNYRIFFDDAWEILKSAQDAKKKQDEQKAAQQPTAQQGGTQQGNTNK